MELVTSKSNQETVLNATESSKAKASDIECVSHVDKDTHQTILTKATTLFFKAYHKLTIHLPRRLPSTDQDLLDLKHILEHYHGIEDSPSTWYVIAGQITATQATKMYKSYAHYVNAARRVHVNTLAQKLKEFIIKEHEEKLKTVTEKIVASPSPEPTSPKE